MSVSGSFCVCVCMAGGHPPYQYRECIYQRSQDAVALLYPLVTQHFLAPPSASWWQSRPAVSPLTAEPGSPRPQGFFGCTRSMPSPVDFPDSFPPGHRWPGGGTVSSRQRRLAGAGDPGCPRCLASQGIGGDPLRSLRRHHPNPLLPLLPEDHRFGGEGNKLPPTQKNSALQKVWLGGMRGGSPV